MYFENSNMNMREEEILSWIDELHVMEGELKKVLYHFKIRIILTKLGGCV